MIIDTVESIAKLRPTVIKVNQTDPVKSYPVHRNFLAKNFLSKWQNWRSKLRTAITAFVIQCSGGYLFGCKPKIDWGFGKDCKCIRLFKYYLCTGWSVGTCTWSTYKVLNHFKDFIVLYLGLLVIMRIFHIWQVRLQSYTNLVPVCIITCRYTLTDRVRNILR